MAKTLLGVNVLEASRQRIEWVFDQFEKVCVSFSGGKDSTVMLHMVMDEAIKRNRKVGLLFIDLEAQYKITIEHVAHCYEIYKDYIIPYWVSLPLSLRNGVSVYEPQWMCWDPECSNIWVRNPPPIAITDSSAFPFFHVRMEFEDFVDEFAKHFADGQPAAFFVGIRTQESLNRYRTIAAKNKTYVPGKKWTTWKGAGIFNIYPIYDWQTKDIWVYHGKTAKPHNRLYDLMHKAGLTIHQMRICQPYGDDQRKGLWLYHIIEPETWGKVVARVNGANSGALYSQDSGNINGTITISKPNGHTWKSFAKMLIESMPEKSRVHYSNKISVFLKWWEDRGYSNGIPDEALADDEARRKIPSWRRICKALLRNDYWCKGLSFSQHKSGAYEKYLKVMKERRKKWGSIW